MTENHYIISKIKIISKNYHYFMRKKNYFSTYAAYITLIFNQIALCRYWSHMIESLKASIKE